jgi:hypothetical protein
METLAQQHQLKSITMFSPFPIATETPKTHGLWLLALLGNKNKTPGPLDSIHQRLGSSSQN